MPDHTPKFDLKRRLRFPQLLIPVAILIFLSVFVIRNFPSPAPVIPSIIQPPPLTVLTVLFGHLNTLIDPDIVTHNCLLISQTPHTFIVYTDNHSHPFCDICSCRTFVPVHCHLTCADPNKPGCNHCEKLLFVRDAILSFHQFVFLDTDLIIANPLFLDRLSHRALAHDFLATYGFAGAAAQESNNASLNSGLFFIRRLPSLNYSKMFDIMQDMNTNSDQSVISRFVYQYYTNWDSLSRRWNCRLSFIRRTNYPIKQCYTFHGRGDMDALLQQVGQKMLRLT